MAMKTDQGYLLHSTTEIRQQITLLEAKYNRPPGSVKLLAVSKTFPVAAIEAAYADTQKMFGESYVSEATEKITRLGGLDIEWHFIGSIQSNKTHKISRYFSWVQTVTSEKYARRLNQHRPTSLPPLNCCIQVKISEDTGKSGVVTELIPDLALYIDSLPNLRLRGIMGIPEKQNGLQRQRHVFRKLAEAYRDLCTRGHAVDTLSMGMTGDMEAAIAEGSTMVRIGTAIFGQRQPKTTSATGRP